MRAGPRPSVVAEPATAERPPRRRASWNLRTIVEDVAGRPIEELQDPARPPHPYLKGAAGPGPVGAPPRHRPAEEEPPAPEDDEGFDRIRPPLVGATGRAFHGPEREHHAETLARHAADRGSGGPTRRPERLYLHYLLLHLDRLGESALRYLRAAIDEELDHRHPGSAPPVAAPEPPATPAAPSAQGEAAPPPPDGPGAGPSGEPASVGLRAEGHLDRRVPFDADRVAAEPGGRP